MIRRCIPVRAAFAGLKRFFADRAGASAIEFCWVAPVFILLYLGVFEGSRVYEAGRKTNSTAETLGDLVARTKSTTVDDLEDVFAVGRALMSPFDTSDLTMRITAVKLDASGQGKVEWSRKSGRTKGLNKGTNYDIPVTLTSGGDDFVIFVDVGYSYESPLVKPIVGESLSIDRRFAVVPRTSRSLPCSDCT